MRVLSAWRARWSRTLNVFALTARDRAAPTALGVNDAKVPGSLAPLHAIPWTPFASFMRIRF
jgi:hypothetical protein